MRFFYKKIDNFLTKIDIDLIFFLEIAYELGAIIKIYEKKKKNQRYAWEKPLGDSRLLVFTPI